VERGETLIKIAESELVAMVNEARVSYPEECCGALLGTVGSGEARRVLRAVPIFNGRLDERRRRYLIGPDDVRIVEDAAAQAGLDVLGFYHSHPDHPAVPSGFDQDHAWPWYTYVIVPVQEGRPGRPRAWQLSDDRQDFAEIQWTEKESA
jgi:proteasome lid subunit RPN8/RPN11